MKSILIARIAIAYITIAENYDMIRYIYVRSKADKMERLV